MKRAPLKSHTNAGRHIGKHPLAILPLALFAVSASAFAITPVTINVPGASQTFCYGVNAKGDLVGAYNDSQFKLHGYFFSQGVFRSIDFPGAFFTEALGINQEGDIVGEYIPAGGSSFSSQGFLLHGEALVNISFPGADSTQAYGINSDGDIVGLYNLPGVAPLPGMFPHAPFHGFVLHHGAFTTIDFPSAIQTEALGINSDGDIVGLYNLPGGASHGFVRRGGAFSTIDAPGSFATEADGINGDGDIVGLYSGLGANGGLAHGFLLQEGRFTEIDIPGTTWTFGSAINGRGDIAGSYLDASGVFHGFLIRAQDRGGLGRDEPADSPENRIP